MKNVLFLFLCFFILSAEKCENKGGADGYKFPATTYVEMKKTGCFGRCPIYEIKIDGSGTATYNGQRFVEKEGKFEKKFEPSEVNALMQAFIEADYWSFEDEYIAEVTDLAYTYLTFSHDGKTKKITLYYDVPDELINLSKLVASFAESEGWTGGNVK